ncbi:MAG: fibrillarin-like rRNA/tRNA 2'-O-methyltransferase [Thermoplasmata archaeon]
MILKKCGEYYTLNKVPGKSIYGERLMIVEGKEYRHWNPHRSKLAAYLKEGGSLPIDKGSCVLYLGAGDGTTVSHLSDILTNGYILAVELSSKPFKNLLSLSEKRSNIFPILCDARNPWAYDGIVESIDFTYQDIAQPDQVKIFIKNLKHFPPPCAGIAVKARSIDVTRRPGNIFKEAKRELKEADFEILDMLDISRWQKDHAIIMIK